MADLPWCPRQSAASSRISFSSAAVSLGPKGGNAISCVANPNNPDEVLVVSFITGIFRSLDGGDTFDLTPYGTGLGGDVVRSIHHDPNLATGLFARGENGIYQSADFGATAARPSYSVLDSSKLAAALGNEIPTWQDALRRYLAER